MSMVATLLIVVCILWVALALFRALSGQSRGYHRERACMPADLSSAELVASEMFLCSRGAYPFHGKTDQVFLTQGRQLIPTETKTRSSARVHASDVIQLSVQARLLRDAPRQVTRGATVASYGYVRFPNAKGGPRYARVQLIEDAALDALHVRYGQLHSGSATPKPAARPGLCRGCLQAPQCPRPHPPIASIRDARRR